MDVNFLVWAIKVRSSPLISVINLSISLSNSWSDEKVTSSFMGFSFCLFPASASFNLLSTIFVSSNSCRVNEEVATGKYRLLLVFLCWPFLSSTRISRFKLFQTATSLFISELPNLALVFFPEITSSVTVVDDCLFVVFL